MFLRDSIEPCATCGEATAHTRRALSPQRVLALLFAGGAVVAWPVGAVLLAPALVLFLAERRSEWRIACSRCRSRAHADHVDARPTLDGRTEIHLS